MDGRAQGAMEYLMSYGWAILVILAVGGAMWQLGVLDIGGSIPPTAAGFQALKPLLPTCEMKNTIWWGTYSGFTCQFVNVAGGEVMIKDINITVDGKYCSFPLIDLIPAYLWGESFYFYRSCPTTSTCFGPISVDSRPPTHFCNPANTPDCYLPVPNGGQFSVDTFTWPLARDDPCADIVDGRPYSVDVDLTYEIDVGGVAATKVSSGRIQLTGKE